MGQEAEITVNGTKLTHNEARIVRVALTSVASILANDKGFNEDGNQLAARYQADIAHVLMLLENRQSRAQ